MPHSAVTLFQLMVLLVQSNLLILATPLYPLKLICIMLFFTFEPLQSDNCVPFIEKVTNKPGMVEHTVIPTQRKL
jgi:hypothetical protein